MQIKWLRKCIMICVVICMICPKSSCQLENEASQSNYEPRNKTQKKTYEKLNLQLSEPGYDLTEDEVKKFKIWPKGIIPYFIDYLSFDTLLRVKLRSLLDSFNSVTGLGFVELARPPEDEEERWVFFINRRGALGCEDYTTSSFTNTGVQKIVLGYDCLGAGGGAMAATVLALAGVPPQHNAPDRDDYIEVLTDNIIPEKRHLFEVLEDNEWLFHNVPYDILSAGHYDFHKYTFNGSATIIPKKSELLNVLVGEGDGISSKDIWKIRMLYNYISKSRKLAKASDCSQIFKPGRNFGRFKPLKHDIIIPREKPRKYLGLSEEKPSVESDGQQSNKNTVSQDESTVSNESEKDSDANVVKPSLDRSKLKAKLNKKAKDTLAELHDFDTDFDIKSRNKRVKLSGKLKQSRDKLGSLQDFDTDEVDFGNRMGRPYNKKNRKGLPRKLSKFSIMSDYDTDRMKG